MNHIFFAVKADDLGRASADVDSDDDGHVRVLLKDIGLKSVIAFREP